MRKSGYEIKVKLLVGFGLHIIEVSGSSILHGNDMQNMIKLSYPMASALISKILGVPSQLAPPSFRPGA
jgi:lambda repressor-like predicted transcriptional regulator